MKTESNRIEYKRQLTDGLEKEVIAFLNYHKRGIVYIGIDADGSVVGVNDSDALQLKIKDRLVEGLVEGLADSQKKIVKLIANNPKISKKEMSESVGISTTAIDKNISTLKNKNIIKRVGSDKGGSWQIIKTEI